MRVWVFSNSVLQMTLIRINLELIKLTTYCLAPAPVTREDIVKTMLAFVVILLIWSIIKFAVESSISEDVANEFAWIVKPSIVFGHLPSGRRLVAGGILG